MKKNLRYVSRAEEIEFSKGHILAHTHAKVKEIHFLKSGELEYYISDEITGEETVLFSTSQTGMIIGWEALNPPERFISSVRVKTDKATLQSLSLDSFNDQLTTALLSDICQQLYHLLEISFYRQTDLLSSKVKQGAVHLEKYFISHESELAERVQLLRSSPFFGEFQEDDIESLAKTMERREYAGGELIHEQDEDTEGIFILIQGEVSIRRQEDEVYLNLRSISTPGYIFGWSSSFNQPDICRASTQRKTSVYFIANSKLKALVNETTFGVEYFKMVVWLLNNQMQLSHSRYVHLLDDHNLVSVKHLIDINRPNIPLPSPLHQIPHLLKDISTQSLAFSILHDLHDQGTRQERHLASICLDLLVSEERESKFVEALGDVYKVVSSSPAEQPETNRKICAAKTREVLKNVKFHLEGVENLPSHSGHIFIYNHLANHPYYTLNNNFQITLDSHFISAVILDERYEDPGIRTVRIGKSFEFGHEDYYKNLGYINVFTRDSDKQDEASKIAAKEQFYQTAENYLQSGTNIIISPEGTSYITEESPGPFKMGPFNLAMQLKEEPYIVPIVFCNFDKRITETVLYCKILKPFKISESKGKGQNLKEFVTQYQKAFSLEVEEARQEANRLTQKLRNN